MKEGSREVYKEKPEFFWGGGGGKKISRRKLENGN